MIDDKVDLKRIANLLKSIKPKCPYCGEDVSYAYYGNDGSRYCPNCMKQLKKRWRE